MTAGGGNSSDPAAPGAAGSSASQPPPGRAPDQQQGPPRAPGETRPTLTAADKAAVEGQALRRRQLRAALCHGSDRSWRDRHRVWPACVGGVVVAVLICAGIGVYGAFEQQQRLDQEEQRRQEYQRTRKPASVTVTATASPTDPGIVTPSETDPGVVTPPGTDPVTSPPTGASTPIPTATP